MKRILFIILLIAVIAGSYFLVVAEYPKTADRYPAFVILFLLDIYLYFGIKHRFDKSRPLRYGIFVLAYWTPLIILAAFVFSNLILSYTYWNKEARVYLMGFVLISYISKFIIALFYLLSDLIYLIKRRFSTKKSKQGDDEVSEKITRGAFLKKMGLVTGGIMFGTLFTGMFKWIYDFNVIKLKVRIPGLPASFEGTRIVQLADMHLGNWMARDELKRVVEIINEQKADFFFFTGDLVNYRTDEAFEFEDILYEIEAKYGKYSVLGNHDYGDYTNWPSQESKEENMKKMYELNKRLKWNLLLNENEIVMKGNDALAIIGVQNWGSYARFQRLGDLETAINGAEDAQVKILLSHDPTHWQYKVRDSKHHIDLTLAGHTHGGQFGFETKGLRWSPVKFTYKYWAGLYSHTGSQDEKPRHLYVNRGLGVVGYPGRVGIRPEITVLELTA